MATPIPTMQVQEDLFIRRTCNGLHYRCYPFLSSAHIGIIIITMWTTFLGASN